MLTDRVRSGTLAMCLFALLLGGCRSPTETSPTIVGEIAQTQADPFRIRVATSADDCGIWFSVDSDTEISVSTATGSTTSGSGNYLQVGVEVSVWADGYPLLGCPGSGRAERVLITGQDSPQ